MCSCVFSVLLHLFHGMLLKRWLLSKFTLRASRSRCFCLPIRCAGVCISQLPLADGTFGSFGAPVTVDRSVVRDLEALGFARNNAIAACRLAQTRLQAQQKPVRALISQMSIVFTLRGLSVRFGPLVLV